MIKLVYRLYEKRENLPLTETPLKGWNRTSSQDRWLAILKACETSVKKYRYLRVKLILTVELELPTTSEEPLLEDFLQASPSLGLEQISRISRKAYDQSSLLIEDTN